MTMNEKKAKYGRIASDPSQLEMFKNDLIDGKIGFPDFPADETKQYVLSFVDGQVQWIENGSIPPGPTPDEPDIEGEELVVTDNEQISDNMLLIENATFEDHSMII